MSNLQDRVNELVEYILGYNYDYWSGLGVQLTKKQAENMASILIDRLTLDDANIEDAYNQMLEDEMEPPDNPDQVYADAFQATWKN